MRDAGTSEEGEDGGETAVGRERERERERRHVGKVCRLQLYRYPRGRKAVSGIAQVNLTYSHVHMQDLFYNDLCPPASSGRCGITIGGSHIPALSMSH